VKIEILGTGCQKCKKLTELTEKALNELGVSVEIIKVTDINKIIDYGVMVTPALVIDGDVKMAGKIPEKEGIKRWIEEELKK